MTPRLWKNPCGWPLALLVLALLVVAWAPDAATGQGVYWFHDLRHHHYPWRVWAASEWASGQLPLWCSGAANGYPLLADGQAGVLYPPTMLLFLVLPGPLALNASILLHTLWMGLGTFLLARSLGRSERAALLAAVAFAFCGFVITHTLYLGMQNAMAWLPFTLWSVVRACDPAARRLRGWAGVGLGLWLMVVAGHIQIGTYGWLLTGLVVLWRAGVPWREPRVVAGRWLSFAAAALVAVALAAPQLAATLELTRFSMRDGGVAAAFAGIGSLPPAELMNGLMPGFFGFDRPADIPQTYYHRGTGYWGSGENHWEMAFYLGIPVLILASWTLLARKRERFWSGLALISVLLMLGRFTPFYAIFRMLPGMGWFRFPARFGLWLSLAVAMLAASGLDGLLDAVVRGELVRVRVWMGRLLTVGAIGGGLLLILHGGLTWDDTLVRDRLNTHFMSQTALPPPPPDLGPLQMASLPAPEVEDPTQIPAKVDRILASLRHTTDPLSPDFHIPVAVALLTLASVGLLVGGRITPRSTALAVSALVVVDLWAFGHDYQARVPYKDTREPPPFLSVLEGDPAEYRVTVVDRRNDPAYDTRLASASLGLLWGLRDVIITSPLLLVRNDAYLALAGLDIGHQRGRIKVDTLLANLPVASRLGVKYLSTLHDIEDPRLERVMDGEVKLYRNLESLPLARLVGCVRQAGGPETILAVLPKTDPSIAWVEADDLPDSLTTCSFADEPGSATVVAHSSNDWSIHVDASRDALLVVAETAYPGWEARVDGAPVSILTTDLILRGIPVSTGSHTVELSYRPTWLIPTCVLWGLGMIGLIGLWGTGATGRRV